MRTPVPRSDNEEGDNYDLSYHAASLYNRHNAMNSEGGYIREDFVNNQKTWKVEDYLD